MLRPRLLVAALAVALLLPSCGGTTHRSAAAPISIEAASPRGAVDWPFVFTWKGNVPVGAVCRVSIFDAAERQLLQRDTRDGKLAAPDDLRLLLPSARRFLWRVSVLDEGGNEVAQSPLVEFEVR
jgi:hypothetical protein